MTKPPDENDRWRAGTLNLDPFADCEPMPTPSETPPAAAPPVHLRDFMGKALTRIAARMDGREKPIPLPWTMVQNALNGGLWPGLYVLVGNTGTGRTQFAVEASLHAARHGVPALYVALELGEVDLVSRLFGLTTGPTWSKIYRGEIGATELETARGEARWLEALPLYFEFGDPGGWNHARLTTSTDYVRKAANLADDQPVLVVLDFLQLVSGDERELRERIGRAAYAARDVARKQNAAVLLVSSTAREHYGKLDEKLSVHDLPPPASLVGTGKESGEVEYAADAVLVLVREPWAGNTPPDGGTVVHLAVAKQRAGRPGWAHLRFDGNRFTDDDSTSGEGWTTAADLATPKRAGGRRRAR